MSQNLGAAVLLVAIQERTQQFLVAFRPRPAGNDPHHRDGPGYWQELQPRSVHSGLKLPEQGAAAVLASHSAAISVVLSDDVCEAIM